MYDYLVLGAGPAGCFSATELARKGKKVCILEKNSRLYRKVCGDGISTTCTEILRMMDFPIDWFLAAGAEPIETYYRYKANGTLHEQNLISAGKIAYGIPRNKTDELFRQYAQQEFHIPIFYETPVRNIKETPEGYQCNSLTTRNLIVATGVDTNIKLSGEPLSVCETAYPFGVSMTVYAPSSGRNSFFLFDWKERYGDTYAWIFSIGSGFYNVGLWLRESPERLRAWLQEFYESRKREWLGDGTVVVEKMRGSYMGIGKVRHLERKGLYFVGDADGTCNPEDGEGISRAIVSAKNMILSMEQRGLL